MLELMRNLGFFQAHTSGLKMGKEEFKLQACLTDAIQAFPENNKFILWW